MVGQMIKYNLPRFTRLPLAMWKIKAPSGLLIVERWATGIQFLIQIPCSSAYSVVMYLDSMVFPFHTDSYPLVKVLATWFQLVIRGREAEMIISRCSLISSGENEIFFFLIVTSPYDFSRMSLNPSVRLAMTSLTSYSQNGLAVLTACIKLASSKCFTTSGIGHPCS